MVTTPQRGGGGGAGSGGTPRVAWAAEGGLLNHGGGEGDWAWSPPAGQASSGNRGRAWQEAFSGFHAATDLRR